MAGWPALTDETNDELGLENLQMVITCAGKRRLDGNPDSCMCRPAIIRQRAVNHTSRRKNRTLDFASGILMLAFVSD